MKSYIPRSWLLALVLLPPGVVTAGPSPAPSDNAPGVLDTRPPLQALPPAPKRRLPKAKPEDTAALDAVLNKLLGTDVASRRTALVQVQEMDESLLPAIKERLDKLAEGADRHRMKRLLLDTRQEARAVLQQQLRARGDQSEVETPDYLEMMVTYARPDSDHWKRLTSVLALSRMCVHMASTPATRVLVRVYVRFAFLRIDTQLQINKLGDRSLAALIESTHHASTDISNWARRQLDFLGKAIPSETVQTTDNRALADILRAYGYVKDPQAARLITTFANSENPDVRRSAREAVVLLGDTGTWQLRDTYENTVGRKPSREWNWERTAQELFRAFDQIRMAEVYEFYQQGLEAKRQDHLDSMRVAFNSVLARNPDFEPSDEIVAGYLAFGEKLWRDRPLEARDALSRAVRLTPDHARRKQAESLLLTIRASERLTRQLADQTLLRAALEKNPDNAAAKALLSEIAKPPFVESTSFMRTLWPLVLLLVGCAAAAFVLLSGVWAARRSRPAD